MESKNISINFSPLLLLITIILFLLKMTGTMAISWFWVFFPILLPIAIIILFLGGLVFFILIIALLSVLLEAIE